MKNSPHTVPAFLREGGVAGELMRAIDWRSTAVGPVAAWPASLKTTVGTLLHSRHPMFMWWGPELIQFYNDAYLPSFGKGKHPAAMGQRGADCWQEIWPIIWPQIDDVMSRGKASWHEDQLVPIFRNGRLEEVYWTYGYSPIYEESGAVGGTLVVCTETTSRVLTERRLRRLRLLGDRMAGVTDATQIHATAAETFVGFEADIPFALLYTLEAAGGRPSLAASMGVGASTAAALDARSRERIAARPREAQAAIAFEGEPSLSLPGGPWPEPATHVFLAEIAAPTPLASPAGVVVFGLSPRLPFDAAYRDYLQQLTEQLARALVRIEAFRIRAAAASERRNLLMQAPVATALLTGPQHLFELANPRFRQMVGREVVGRTLREAVPELGESALGSVLDRVYQTGEPFVTNELLVPLDRKGDGHIEDAFFRFDLEPLRDVAGSVHGIMAVAIDITDSVNARRVLERSHREREALLAELESASRAKDEFLAMLGHELRNPLAPIVTALQLMRLRGAGGPSREEQIIQRQVTHLVRLVDDLLDVSRITRGMVELKQETVEVSGVLAKAVEMASFLFEQRSHQLMIDVPRRGLLWYGDPVRLAQVVANLLTNAARYTEVGGRIELAAKGEGAEVVISVKDNGSGISADLLPHVFDMFVQAKRSTDRPDGGLGLGLTLVKTLVTLHGGTVVARSEGLGKGSEFEIRLPSSSPASTTAAPRAVPPAPRTSTPLRILVVDDNADAANLLAEMLRHAGHEIAVAHDPLAALAEAARFQPEMAVLDIGLPVMDGYELASKLRQQVPGCRLIALTGYGQEHDITRGQEAGFERHLVKPVAIDDLLRAL